MNRVEPSHERGWFVGSTHLTTFFYRKTGRIYTGAFLNALLFTWIVVAGTATHFPL